MMKRGVIRLIDAYPEIIHEFVPALNNDIDIPELTVGSTQKVWWKCNKGARPCLASKSQSTNIWRKAERMFRMCWKESCDKHVVSSNSSRVIE
jgi:hypothetical protein